MRRVAYLLSFLLFLGGCAGAMYPAPPYPYTPPPVVYYYYGYRPVAPPVYVLPQQYFPYYLYRHYRGYNHGYRWYPHRR